MSEARRRELLTALSVAALTVGVLVPATSSAGPVKGLLKEVTETVNRSVNDLTGGGPAPSPAPAATPVPQAGVPPAYTPPAHGTNPSGQGTVGVVDATPEGAEPLPYDQDGGSEDLVAGRSRGEQNPDGTYHGHITIASLAPLGVEIAEVGVDSDEGEEAHSPLDPLQQNVLDALCDGSGGQICLGVLQADSATTEDGSSNQFEAASAQLGGPTGITAGVASSNGTISDDGDCQTSHGDSSVANASVGGTGLVSALSSSSDSTACNDGSTTQDNESSGVNLLGSPVPLPQPGCENGTPDTVFNPPVIGFVVSATCNADDSDGAQTDAPYGVREAIATFVLPVLGGGGLVKASTAGSESQAVAPGGGAACPDPTNPDCPAPPACPDPDDPDCPGPGGPGGGDDGDDGTEVEAAGGPGGDDGPPGEARKGPGRDELAFTGADLITLLLIGGGVMGAGLALMLAADRKRGLRRAGK